MCKAHFLVFCDRKLVDTAIQLILKCDTRIEVVSNRTLESEDIDETSDAYNLRRGREEVRIGIIIGDRESQVGPFDGEYWIYIDGKRQGLFNCNERFARELTQILICNGAREARKQGAKS